MFLANVPKKCMSEDEKYTRTPLEKRLAKKAGKQSEFYNTESAMSLENFIYSQSDNVSFSL